MCYNYGTSKLRKVKCSVCGSVFYTDHPTKKTCSLECSMEQKLIAKKDVAKNNKRYYRKVRKVK